MVNIPNGFGQLEVHYNVEGRHDAVNLFGVKLIGQVSNEDLDSVSDPILSAYNNLLTGGSSTTAVRLVQRFDDDLFEVSSIAGHAPGERTDPAVSPQVQVLAVKNTPLAGRKHRGRSFFPDAREGHVSNIGELSSTEQGLYQALADQILDTCHDAVVTDGMYLLHSDLTAPTEVTSFTVSSFVATLRKRYER